MCSFVIIVSHKKGEDKKLKNIFPLVKLVNSHFILNGSCIMDTLNSVSLSLKHCMESP